jgi:copper chaperone
MIMAITSTMLNVKGMSCSHCVNAIETALQELNGVKEVHVDLKESKVSVSFDESLINLGKLKDAIEDEGYNVV